MTDTIRVYYDDFVETTKKAKKYDEVECALTNIRAEIEQLHYHPKLDFIKNDEVVEMAIEIIDKYRNEEQERSK